jgi:hypothetical protein
MAPAGKSARSLAVAVAASAAVWLAGAGCAAAACREDGDRAGAAAHTEAASTEDLPHLTHVRALNAKVAGILEEGLRRSATFRRVALALEDTDVIVLVRTGVLASLSSKMAFRGASSNDAPPDVRRRFLEITLNVPELDDRLVPWLAHEMQHALEIASDPSVTDGATFALFFRKHGVSVRLGDWCTVEAQKVRTLVAQELAASAGGHHRR